MCLRVLLNLSGIFPLEHFDTDRVHLMWQQLGMSGKVDFFFFFAWYLQPAGNWDKFYAARRVERPESFSETWRRYVFAFSVVTTARKKKNVYFLERVEMTR